MMLHKRPTFSRNWRVLKFFSSKNNEHDCRKSEIIPFSPSETQKAILYKVFKEIGVDEMFLECFTFKIENKIGGEVKLTHFPTIEVGRGKKLEISRGK